jgi:hypothetical protein
MKGIDSISCFHYQLSVYFLTEGHSLSSFSQRGTRCCSAFASSATLQFECACKAHRAVGSCLEDAGGRVIQRVYHFCSRAVQHQHTPVGTIVCGVSARRPIVTSRCICLAAKRSRVFFRFHLLCFLVVIAFARVLPLKLDNFVARAIFQRGGILQRGVVLLPLVASDGGRCSSRAAW